MRDLDLLLPEYETVRFRGKDYLFPTTQVGLPVEAQMMLAKFQGSGTRMIEDIPSLKNFCSLAATPQIPKEDLEGISGPILEALVAAALSKTPEELQAAGKAELEKVAGKKKTKGKRKAKKQGS
jgi:hypothetical protein